MRSKFLVIALFCLVFSVPAYMQDSTDAVEKPEDKPAEAPAASPTPELSQEEVKGINVVELSLLVYSGGFGRSGLDRIRKTWVEFGTIEFVDGAGRLRKGKYEYRTERGENVQSTKIRFDHKLPDADYALVFSEGKMRLVFNNSSFDPDVNTKRDFSNIIWRGISSLFQYKESGAKLLYARDEKVLGVEYAVVKMTSKDGMETEYYISKRTARIMMLKYEQDGVKYKRKFYDYNIAQNTLFPYRTVLWADDKKVEERRTQTVTFGQEFESDPFTVG